MTFYSLDLRQRIVDAVERGTETIESIARLFSVSESFIYKLLRQKLERGDIAPLPHGGGAEAKLKEDELNTLRQLVEEFPDATLDELRAKVKKKTGVEASVPTIWRALESLGLSRKKKSKRAGAADPVKQAAFEEEQKTLEVKKLVFIDEFRIDTTMTREYARAPRGARAAVVEPFTRECSLSTISALSLTGIETTMALEGAIDSVVYEAFVEHFLVPTLLKGDIVLADNVKFHYSARAISLIEAAGASVKFIPAYSPQYNPIEECISKLKEILRAMKARTKRKLLNALAKAIEQISIDDVCGWFAHCGYTFTAV
jgi:transposase